jgi:4-aminobutyrate aminotransferase-like enzyme
MPAGLAALEVLAGEKLGERAVEAGAYLRERLRQALAGYEMIKEIRGLLNAIEFTAPPLAVEDQHPEEFVRGVRAVVEEMHLRSGFWPEALGIARRVLNV